ncbi:hypothetical protein [Zavarzinia sp. CC-PAN008]|uniref:hypothetical protein n=1 Tax=Zavarzinia sp. CC-PAN008 TaxID=3243332 RepID=UPI003F749A3F
MKSALLTRLFRKAADLFDDGGTPGAVRVRASDYMVSDSAQRLDPRDQEGFNRRLVEFRERHARAVNALMAGSVQMLGLGDLARRFGKDWEDMKFKAHRIAEAAIEHRIGPTDLYVVVNEEYYVILFADLPKDEAERRARLIASEITSKLCGTVPWGGSVSVRGIALKVDPAAIQEGEPLTLNTLIRSLQSAEMDEEEAERKHFEALRSEIVAQYWPTLNARKRIVSAYEMTLAHRGGLPLVPPANGSITGRFQAELDMMALDIAARQLRSKEGVRARSILMVPLHWETLAVRVFRERYVAAARLLPKEAKRRLVPQILDLAPGTPQSRLREVVQTVWPFTLGFMCRHALEPGDGTTLVGSGLLSLSVDAEGMESSAALRGDLAEFVAWSGDLGFRSMLSGVADVRLASAATKAGIEYLNGPAFLRATDNPSHVFVMSGMT